MNPDTREFETETETTPAAWSRFTVGELIPIKGWFFKVVKIQSRELILEVQNKTKKSEKLFWSIK